MGPPSEIIPGLWLANFESAQDKATLRKLNVSRILTVGNRSPIDNSLLTELTTGETRQDDDGFLYKLVFAMDSTEQNLLKHFADCFAFIRAALETRTGIMVHCHMGFSRSAALVIGYLMHAERLTYAQAFDRARKKRIIGPNSGFVRQLGLFQQNEWNLEMDYGNDEFVLGKDRQN